MTKPSDETETPPEFYAEQVRLYAREGALRFDLDAAASHTNALARRYYTEDGAYHRVFENVPPARVADTNGLTGPWGHAGSAGADTRVWVNPPYSDIRPWVAKAWQEMADSNGPHTIVMLLPARTDAPWWRDMVEPFRDGRAPIAGLRFETHFHGRLAFLRNGEPIPATKDGVVLARKKDGRPRKGSARFGVVTLVWRREQK